MIVHYHSLQNKGDVLPALWDRLRADDPPPWLWGNYSPLTLTEFVLFFSDPSRHLFLWCTPDANDIIGMIWIDEIAIGQRARAHFYFLSHHRRKRTSRIKEAGQQVLQILGDAPFNLQTLLLFTDSRAVEAKHVATRHFGATYFGDIPGYYPGEVPVSVGYLPVKGNNHGRPFRQRSSNEPISSTSDSRTDHAPTQWTTGYP